MKRFLLPILALTVGCGGSPREEAPVVAVAAVAARPAPPALPDVALTPLFVETGSPYSRCMLSVGSPAGLSEPSELVTDHRGIITLHVADVAPAPSVAYSCTDAAGKVTAGTADSPMIVGAQKRLSDLRETMPSDARALPALHGDLTAIPEDSLLARGYPPRPDSKATDAYAAWVEAVSRDMTFIPPHPVRTSQRHDNNAVFTSASYWSGVVIENPATNPYKSVFGYWNVPTLRPINGVYWSFNQNDILLSTVVTWVGLGGWRTGSLVQSGTDDNVGRLYNWGSMTWNFYYTTTLWNEWFPGYQTTLSMAVNPGDSLQVHSWVGDAQGRLTVTGRYAWTYIINNTRNTATSAAFAAPAGVAFDGTSAEWIMETTGVLANYGSLNMPSSSFAQANDGSIHQWFNDPFYWVVLLESSDGTVRNNAWTGWYNDPPYTSYSLHFQWTAP